MLHNFDVVANSFEMLDVARKNIGQVVDVLQESEV